MNVADLNDLFRHMEWADAAVWTAVRAGEAASTDAKLRETLHHIHVVQHAFLQLWRGVAREKMSFPTFDALDPLMAWGQAYYGEVFDHLGTLTNERISDPMPTPWADLVEKQIGRRPETATIGETARQVAFHSLYHRGQVNARLRELGGEPPLVDYIAWVWLGRPTPIWPADGSA